MSESSCGVSSCGSNGSGVKDTLRMAGSSGACTFIKQERAEGDSYTVESRLNGELESNRNKEDHKHEMSNERVRKLYRW